MFQQHPVSICFYLLFALSLLFLAPRDNDNIILLTFMCGSAISMCIYGVETWFPARKKALALIYWGFAVIWLSLAVYYLFSRGLI